MSTAADTRSGLASISSWAMNEPIDTDTTRTGPASSFSISLAVSKTTCSVVKPCAFSVAPTPRLSNVMTRYPAR